ncbi:hypothetical protein L207DRAFT_512684 [Hyaloscypha variabilis F]|uniref:Uncharacterized protein n=1 Tax=Hyaloscypha variabilis (strain UAMH 11265 / GT02V1 / F) TaxID=1149755 RepID=A0A2J6RMH6_HYAVF|nr:hypothetical protein L207DRAFT_512684 [Hyaloscypha variabilis F]
MQKPNPERQTQPFNALTRLRPLPIPHPVKPPPLKYPPSSKSENSRHNPQRDGYELDLHPISRHSPHHLTIHHLNSEQEGKEEERQTLTDLPSAPPVTVGKVVFVPATPALALPLGTTTVLSRDVCVVVVFAGALIVTFVEIDFAVAVGVMIAAGVEVGMDVGGEARVGIATARC